MKIFKKLHVRGFVINLHNNV